MLRYYYKSQPIWVGLLGYQPEEYIGTPYSEFHADKKLLMTFYAIHDGEMIKITSSLKFKDGSIKHVQE